MAGVRGSFSQLGMSSEVYCSQNYQLLVIVTEYCCYRLCSNCVESSVVECLRESPTRLLSGMISRRVVSAVVVIISTSH